jgi:hypothetical protein
MTTETITPNAPQSTATVDNASAMDQGIYEKMTAMRELTQRNQLLSPKADETGPSAEANAEIPVAPDEPEITSLEDHDIDRYAEDDTQDSQEEPVSDTPEANSSADELIDFIEFAETNPNAKFKFMRNGKEVVIDAKRAASILGQGGAIHEEARQLKVERAEFDEYTKAQREHHDGLTLAMEFTVAPRLQRAYDEIIKTQQYNQVFYEQLARTQDAGQQAQIQANIQQNERYMQQQGGLINQIKPRIDQFRELRQQQVSGLLEQSRQSFTDKELKNSYVFNELRDKLSKQWNNASGETLPGIKNIDLVTSDETLLGLIRDGLKYRDRPASKQAGSSMAVLTRKSSTTPNSKGQEESISKLREQAKGRGKEATQAADNLLVAQLSKLRAARGGR